MYFKSPAIQPINICLLRYSVQPGRRGSGLRLWRLEDFFCLWFRFITALPAALALGTSPTFPQLKGQFCGREAKLSLKPESWVSERTMSLLLKLRKAILGATRVMWAATESHWSLRKRRHCVPKQPGVKYLKLSSSGMKALTSSGQIPITK